MQRLFEGGTYSSSYCNWQLESLLYLGQIVIIFRTLLHSGQNVITFRPSTAHSKHRDLRHAVAGKSLTVRSKKWSPLLTGGGRLLQVSTVRLWLGKFWCFGLAVVYRTWTLMRGGRTRRFNRAVKCPRYPKIDFVYCVAVSLLPYLQMLLLPVDRCTFSLVLWKHNQVASTYSYRPGRQVLPELKYTN